MDDEIEPGKPGGRYTHFSDDRLEHEIGWVNKQLDELRQRRLNAAMVAGSAGGGTGFEPAHVREQNRLVDTGGNRTALETKLRALKQEQQHRH